MVLGRAKIAGLLGGRKTERGLLLAPKEPITRAELVVLISRYMELCRLINV